MGNTAKGERGFALVAVLLVLLLAAILGAGLLTVTLNSHHSVLATENQTRARYLAETGAKAGYSKLQSHVKGLSFEGWSDLAAKIGALDGTIHLPPTRLNPDKPDETYQYHLILNNTDTDDTSQNPAIPRRLTRPDEGLYTVYGNLVGVGTARGKTVTITIPVQISSLAEVFNFAVSASQNIWLNGGVKINGDIYAGNAVALHKYAHFNDFSLLGWLLGIEQHYEESVYPEVNGKISAGDVNSTSHAIYHIPYQGKNEEKYDSVGKHDISGAPLNPNSIGQYLNGEFETSKVGSIELPIINFQEKRDEVRANSGNGTYHYLTDYKLEWDWENLRFKWVEKRTQITFSKNGTWHNREFYENPYNGIWYINGDLTIDGEVQINGTVYVDGNVTIKDIRTTNPISAVIIASGSFDLYNNNRYKNSPAILNAFLWTTEGALRIYGVGSNIQINGGVIANNIVFNGVRGDTEGWNFLNLINAIEFDAQTLDKPARLTINYDKNFIKNPPSGAPTIKGLQVTQNGNWQISY